MSVAKRLAPLGLLNTLITVKRADQYDVSRIKTVDDTVELNAVGSFSSDHVPAIGRIGIPDPVLGVAWKNSMAFYGKWFDNIGETDPGYRLRTNISSLSHNTQLEQIGRDDQYALVGSYYSVFQTVMNVKGRVPLVLIDDTHISLVSFPVVLPRIEDDMFEKKLLDMLGFMLRPDQSNSRAREPDPLGLDGFEVDGD
jgi:hypothetical protein